MKKWSELSLNGLQLKLLGWFFTLFHLASLLFFPEGGSVVATVLSFIGYMALPIFAFLLVEGFAYTENRIRYVLLLLGAAVLTEPFYDYFHCGVWFDFEAANGQNILFTYVVGIVQLYFISSMGTRAPLRTVLTVIMVFSCAIWMLILNVPYGGIVQLLIGIFYLLHEHPRVKNWLAAAVGLVTVSPSLMLPMVTPALMIPVLTCYNDEPGEYNKYIFYIAYPLVWIVAAMLKRFVL